MDATAETKKLMNEVAEKIPSYLQILLARSGYIEGLKRILVMK